MERSDTRCVGEVAVFSAAGAVIGGIAAIHFGITAPIGVIIAIMVGGLTGYILYQPREAAIALWTGAKAAKSVVRRLDIDWAEIKTGTKVVLVVAGCMISLASWLILFQIFPRTRDTGFGLPLAAITLLVSMIASKASKTTPEKWFPVAWWRYLNVVAAAIWTVIGFALLLRAALRGMLTIGIWAPRFWLAIRTFTVVFTITFFRKIHSHWRGICAMSAATGAVTGFLTHNVLLGAIVASSLAICVSLASIAAVRIRLPELATDNGNNGG